MLSSVSQQKLTALQHQLDGWLVLQILVEWVGYPTQQPLAEAFVSLTNRPLPEDILKNLQQLGYLTLSTDTPTTLQLTLAGFNTLKKLQTSVSVLDNHNTNPPYPTSSMLQPPEAPPNPTQQSKPPATTTLLPIPHEESLTEAHWQLYEILLEARYHVAEKEGIKPQAICSNGILRSIAVHQPTDYSALEQLAGVNRTFIQKFGATVISLTTANLLK
jgi:superfamily II DNA helicase RecQ